MPFPGLLTSSSQSPHLRMKTAHGALPQGWALAGSEHGTSLMSFFCYIKPKRGFLLCPFYRKEKEKPCNGPQGTQPGLLFPGPSALTSGLSTAGQRPCPVCMCVCLHLSVFVFLVKL